MSDDELAQLNALASAAGLTASDIVRLLIREAYGRQFGDLKPAARAVRR